MRSRVVACLLQALPVLLAPLEFLERVRQKAHNVAAKTRLGGSGTFFVHRSGQVIGTGIAIGQDFYAGPGLRLESVTAYHGMTFTPTIIIKDNVTLNDYVHIGANHHVELGNNVLVASKVYISDHGHGSYVGADQSSPDTAPAARPLTTGHAVVIEDNVWIGESASVLAGVRIGRGSIIGANAVVTSDIPPYSIAVGVPARVIKKYNHVAHRWDAVARK
jgi:acetyltransferase-like isoleucine patch superfamily enzyme